MAFNKEANLIFCMGVFGYEFLAQLLTLGVVRLHSNRIHRGIAPIGLHPGNLCCVGGKNVGLNCLRTELDFGWPTLEFDSSCFQLGFDYRRICTL